MANEYNTTDYHAFKDPLFGAKDYQQYLSDNIQAYDERVVKRGLLADRPAASKSGRVYITTDTDNETIYLDKGSSWKAVAGVNTSATSFEAGDGSAASPSYTFSNDTDTGMYSPSADLLRFATGGSLGMSLTAALDLELPNGGLTSTSGGYTAEADSGTVTDGTAVNSPPATLRGYYDSDTTTTVTATAIDAVLKTVASYNGGAGSAYLEAVIDGTQAAKFNDDGSVDFPNGDVTDGTNTVYDALNTEVPQARLGGPASSLTSYPLPAADIDDGAGSGLDADTRDGDDHADELQKSPNAHIQFTEIPAGDYTAIPVHVPANSTFKLYMWGTQTDSQTAPANLDLVLYNESTATQVNSHSSKRGTGNPISSVSAGTAADDLTLRLENNTTTDPIIAGANFGFEVV